MSPVKTKDDGPIRAVTYARVSTEEQKREGFSLGAQQDNLARLVEMRGFEHVHHVADQGSGRSMKRPGLEMALEMLREDQADVLVVVRQDRLTRDTGDFQDLMRASVREGWMIWALDTGDTSTPSGRLVATILSGVAQFESEMIGVRTSEGMRKSQAEGNHIGRPRSPLDRRAATLIGDMRSAGHSGAAIADRLNIEDIPTPSGLGNWHAKTVLEHARRIEETTS